MCGFQPVSHSLQGNSADICSLQAKKLLARKTAAANAKKSSNSAAATLAAKEAKERAAKKAKIRDKKNYNQVCLITLQSPLRHALSTHLAVPIVTVLINYRHPPVELAAVLV